MKPYLVRGDDGSLLIEWIGSDVRFGISLETDLDESSWYFILRSFHAEGDKLPMEILDAIAGHITAYQERERERVSE